LLSPKRLTGYDYCLLTVCLTHACIMSWYFPIINCPFTWGYFVGVKGRNDLINRLDLVGMSYFIIILVRDNSLLASSESLSLSLIYADFISLISVLSANCHDVSIYFLFRISRSDVILRLDQARSLIADIRGPIPSPQKTAADLSLGEDCLPPNICSFFCSWFLSYLHIFLLMEKSN